MILALITIQIHAGLFMFSNDFVDSIKMKLKLHNLIDNNIVESPTDHLLVNEIQLSVISLFVSFFVNSLFKILKLSFWLKLFFSINFTIFFIFILCTVTMLRYVFWFKMV